MATDNSQLIDNVQSVPSELMYTTKASSVRCRQMRANFAPSNGQIFSPSQTAIIYVSSRSNVYLLGGESYIKFTIRNCTNNTTMYTDNGGWCVLNKIDIFMGSALLESISGANILYSAVMDAVFDPAGRVGMSGVWGGSHTLTAPRQGAAIVSTASAVGQLTVCIPLISSILGQGLDKYLSLDNADDFRLEVTFENEVSGMVHAASAAPTLLSGFSTAWQVTNLEYVATLVEIDSAGQQLVNSVSPPSQERIIHGTSYRNYISSVPASSSGQYSCLIAARFCSLNNIITCPRATKYVSARDKYSTSARHNLFDTVVYRVGGANIPARPIVNVNSSNVGGYAEQLAETLKAFGPFTTPMAGSCLTKASFNRALEAQAQNGGVTASNGTDADAYLMAQDFNSFSGKSDILLAGLNSLSTNIFGDFQITPVSGTYDGGAGTGIFDSQILSFHAQHDILFIVKDGLYTCRF